jgi:hypothetical protein
MLRNINSKPAFFSEKILKLFMSLSTNTKEQCMLSFKQQHSNVYVQP